jgi:phosphoglycerate dehydrogenase-like enzyme
VVTRSQIIAVGSLSLVRLLADIAESLRRLGHNVAFYENPAAFHHSVASLNDVDALIASPIFDCSRSLMASANRLRGVVSPVTGTEGFDIGAATELGIIVANGQTRENTESIAESTILLMLAALYDLHGTESVLRHNLPRPAQMTARMLRGKTIGMIGFGQIARAIAQIPGEFIVILCD